MGNARGGTGSGDSWVGPDWPPDFPHLAIDDLVDRLEHAQTLDVEEACELLALIAKEAQRLRATVVRLSAAKLTEADREARTIVTDALRHAETMRELGLAALNERLDEGDRLLAGMRQAFDVELRAARVSSAWRPETYDISEFPTPPDDPEEDR